MKGGFNGVKLGLNRPRSDGRPPLCPQVLLPWKCTKNAPTPVLNTQNIYGINHDDYNDGQRQTNLSLRASATETRFLSASALQECSLCDPRKLTPPRRLGPKGNPCLKGDGSRDMERMGRHPRW